MHGHPDETVTDSGSLAGMDPDPQPIGHGIERALRSFCGADCVARPPEDEEAAVTLAIDKTTAPLLRRPLERLSLVVEEVRKLLLAHFCEQAGGILHVAEQEGESAFHQHESRTPSSGVPRCGL